jgi:hypothetical protein
LVFAHKKKSKKPVTSQSPLYDGKRKGKGKGKGKGNGTFDSIPSFDVADPLFAPPLPDAAPINSSPPPSPLPSPPTTPLAPRRSGGFESVPSFDAPLPPPLPFVRNSGGFDSVPSFDAPLSPPPVRNSGNFANPPAYTPPPPPPPPNDPPPYSPPSPSPPPSPPASPRRPLESVDSSTALMQTVPSLPTHESSSDMSVVVQPPLRGITFSSPLYRNSMEHENPLYNRK